MFDGDKIVPSIMCDLHIMQLGATQQQGITCIQDIILHNNKGNYIWDVVYVYLNISNHAH